MITTYFKCALERRERRSAFPTVLSSALFRIYQPPTNVLRLLDIHHKLSAPRPTDAVFDDKAFNPVHSLVLCTFLADVSTFFKATLVETPA